MLKVRVHTDGLDTIKGRLAHGATETEHITAVQARKDTAPFVPALTVSLDQRARVDGGTIIYPGPYARFLYFGKVMVDPNTGSTFAPKGGMKVVTDRDLVFNKTVHPQAQDHWFEASKALNLEKWIRVAGKAVSHELGK